MFCKRPNLQNPDDELYANFKASFPWLVTQQQRAPVQSRHYGEPEDIKDQDLTSRGSNGRCRITPALLDPNSFAFSAFANQPPGYYALTPGGMDTIYRSQTGYLHTPGFTIGLATPLSLSTSEAALDVQSSTAPLHAFHIQNHLATYHFENPSPFTSPHQPPHAVPESLAPHQFQHQPSAFEAHDDSPNSPTNTLPMNVEMLEQTSLTYPLHAYEPNQTQRAPPEQQVIEQFRWHVTLNAPTAMIKHVDEIPVTYLNKGQVYSVAVVDTVQGKKTATPSKYRTYIRISFEDEQQRQRPSACWQLWKEGRGTTEAHQRGGRLQAVEFVDPIQAGGGEINSQPKIELESASFDSLCITWTPAPNQPPECSITVRFNFLSTDFSHSKGVRGTPVRLCAKTEMLSNGVPGTTETPKPEICFCKVKLFRDHGAERKLSNDIAHVQKSIDKLKQQIAQAESGAKDFGKRRRSGSVAKGTISLKPGKVPKHKRTRSMSSHSSTGNQTAEEDLPHKLATLQDMFTSTRLASILCIRGEDLDDPETHPVQLAGETRELTKIDTGDTTMRESQSTIGSTSIVPPKPNNQSIKSGERRSSGFQFPTAFQPPARTSSNEWRNMLGQVVIGDIQPTATGQMNPPDEPVKIQKHQCGDISTWMEALREDQGHQPPPERIVYPIACFYVQLSVVGEAPEDNYYQAIYLMQRTLKDLISCIAGKFNIKPTQVVRTLRINPKGIIILMDDDDVRKLPQGQDMLAKFLQVNQPQTHVKREWDAGPTDIQIDGGTDAIENAVTTRYELKLFY